MIKLPQVMVSVDFDNGDDRSGQLGMASLGYGIHQAWIYLAMFSTVDIFQLQEVATGIFGTSTSLTLPTSLLAFSGLLLTFGVFNRRLAGLFISGKTMVAGALLTFLGTIILALPSAGTASSLSLFCEVVSGVATGLGTAVLIIFWGMVFSSMNLSSIVLNTTVAIMLAFIILVSVFVAAPPAMTPFLTAVLPLLEIPILLTRTPNYIAHSAKVPYFRSLPVQQTSFALNFLPSVFLFGLALGVLRQVSVQNVIMLALMGDGTMSFLLACIAAFLALFLILSSAKAGPQWRGFFRVLLPVLLVATICLPFAAEGNSVLPACVSLVGYLFFEMFMWIYFSTMAETYRISPVLLFGLGRGMLALAALIGFFVFSWITPVFSASTYGSTGAVVVVLVILFTAYLLLPEDSAFKPQTTVDQGGEDSAAYLFETSIATINKARQETDAATEQEAPPTAVEPAEPAEVKREGKVSLTDTRSGGDIAIRSDEHLARECEAVANTFLLSRREAEVCFLLARGHNSSYIQEKLFISEGTAKTHTRHIYRKLDIHSQEELIRLVEGYSYMD
ncbi:MAG: LuxR C-terminal-related transcriptional regulator [Coriobacteriales bacterium]